MRARRHLENRITAFNKEFNFRDALVRKDQPVRVAAEVTARDAVYKFRLAAVLTAVVYALVFLGSLAWAYNDWAGRGLDITWNIGDNPKTLIATALASGALFLWRLRGVAGKALSLACYVFVLWQFYDWYSATEQVKANVGVNSFPQAAPFGNVLYGASPVELVLLVAVVVLTVFNVYYLLPGRGAAGARAGEDGWPVAEGKLRHINRV